MTYKFKLSRRLATLWAGGGISAHGLMLIAYLCAFLPLACTPAESNLEPHSGITDLWVTPDTVSLTPGSTQNFTASASMSDGSSSSVPVEFSATGGIITSTGQYTAGSTIGHYQVSARTAEGVLGASAVRIDTVPRANPIKLTPQWTVQDDGQFIDVESSVLRVKFGYGGLGSGGWFLRGGGRDGGIVELYYKPTSETRNLVFRNGVNGGKLDGLDYFRAEGASVDQEDHNALDFTSPFSAQLVQHRVWQSAGRLLAEFEFRFEAWHIKRTYILYPWGDITVHAEIYLAEPGAWSLLGHSFHFAASRYDVQNGATYSWGANYVNDGEYYYAWSDGYGPNGAFATSPLFRYTDVIQSGLNKNTAISMFGRFDPYSGFMVDDRNGNDPDIIVMNGDSATWFSPFDQVSLAVGGKSYVETGIFTPLWAPQQMTHVNLNWSYNTTPCCPPQYDNPMFWPATLGTWTESFHLMFRQGLTPDDYVPIWQSRARYIGREPPFEVTGALVRLDPVDRLYHLTPLSGAQRISFKWRRYGASLRAVDYRTAFVIENLPTAGSVKMSPEGGVTIDAYRGGANGDVLMVLRGSQSGQPAEYVITAGD
jgi:hypothetical protein